MFGVCPETMNVEDYALALHSLWNWVAVSHQDHFLSVLFYSQLQWVNLRPLQLHVLWVVNLLRSRFAGLLLDHLFSVMKLFLKCEPIPIS